MKELGESHKREEIYKKRLKDLDNSLENTDSKLID